MSVSAEIARQVQDFKIGGKTEEQMEMKMGLKKQENGLKVPS